MTASGDRTARIWDAETGRQVALLEGHTGFVSSAVFSLDGRHVLTESAGDKSARIWDATTGRQVALLDGDVWSAVLSPDGKHVVTASGGGTATIWQLPDLLFQDRGELITLACTRTLPNSRSVLSEDELQAARFIDPVLERDPCNPPSTVVRFAYWLGIEGWTTGYYPHDPRAAAGETTIQ